MKRFVFLVGFLMVYCTAASLKAFTNDDVQSCETFFGTDNCTSVEIETFNLSQKFCSYVSSSLSLFEFGKCLIINGLKLQDHKMKCEEQVHGNETEEHHGMDLYNHTCGQNRDPMWLKCMVQNLQSDDAVAPLVDILDKCGKRIKNDMEE